jgi:hypothetical protein
MAGRSGFQAAGNITPKSIVILQTTAVAAPPAGTPANAGFQVILASGTTVRPVGISKQWTRWNQLQSPAPAPSLANLNDTYHAVAGENCGVFLVGESGPLIAGAGGVTAGDNVTSDANGHGVTAVTGNECVGQAMETAAAGCEFPCLVNPGTM